jgi:hypothetical protein
MVLDNLAVALEVDKVVVENAIAATAQVIADANRLAEANRDAAWRASFKPHAYLVGSQNRPSQITFYGMTGGPERWLKMPLDLSQPPVTYAVQAHEFVAKTPFVPFFGKTTGFIVNYTPDSAVSFDLHGNPVEHFDKAYIPGQVGNYPPPFSARRSGARLLISAPPCQGVQSLNPCPDGTD